MFSRFEKIVIALMFSLLFAGVTLIAASAQDDAPPVVEEEKSCAECHDGFQAKWENGAHGQAVANPAFTNAWNEQGKPGACLNCHVTGYDEQAGTWKTDGVSCEACHTDNGGEHPKTTMSVDTTPESCGTCHTDARFGWSEWDGSAHFENGMDCANCHDPHSASLKLTGRGADKDASQLCENCHKTVSEEAHGVHVEEGVGCVDCHLTEMTTELPAHTVPNHSFNATLQNCTDCHADQMHSTGEAHKPDGTNASHSSPELKESSLMPDPSPVSPLGYASLAALVGLAAGMLLAPWLERWYRIVVKKTEEVSHDRE